MKYTVALLDGLGNQMFCYAFKEYVKYKTKKKVKISLLFYLTRQDHNGLEIQNAFKNVDGISLQKYKMLCVIFYLLRKPNIRFLLYRLLRNILYRSNICYYEKGPFDFHDIPIETKSFFNGHWQNIKYIEPIKEKILKDFEFNVPSEGEFKVIEEKILATPNSVAIHVRRGDYLSPEYSNWNIFDDYSYFHTAIDILNNKKNNLKFYIFSDDIEGCKNEFRDIDCIFVDCNYGKNSYLDMYLMSLCRNIIISNSTFSWWAAYLNKHLDKIVIAPMQWTKNTKIMTSSFSPDNWIYIN